MKNNDLEYNMCPEYTTLPDEYLQGCGNTIINNNTKKSSLKKMLYMLIAFSTIAYTTIISEDSGISLSPNSNQSYVAEVPDETIGGTTSETPAKEPENVEPPTLPMYPVEDCTSYLVVYNDSYDENNNWSNRVLMESFIFDSTVANGTEYAMPDYEPYEEYIFMGWVVYYNKDYKSGPSIGLIGDSLTLSDFCHIKPDENGSRSIEVHAAWRYDGISQWPNLLTLDANGGTIENEVSITYDASAPMASGSYVYLCAYPVPVREGYTFAGWYSEPDCSGKQQTLLYGASFYETTEHEDGTFGPDWSLPKTITLYAGWIKN